MIRYQRRLKDNRLSEVSPEMARRFVNQCVQQADNIERSARDLDDFDRKRLHNLIGLATELGRHLRRSSRIIRSIAIQVHSAKQGQRWEEKTETRVISRYGALVKWQHSLEIGECVRVVRLDNARKADARVVWYQPKEHGLSEGGIEFQDSENFWDLDWNRIVSS